MKIPADRQPRWFLTLFALAAAGGAVGYVPLLTVLLPQRIAGVTPARARVRAAELLDHLGLADRAGHRPAQLSGGEQQRVAIARAIAKRPGVLRCAQPTGALDSTTGRLVLQAIERINAEFGTATVVITHNVGIGAMADRVIQFADGRLVADTRNADRRPAAELAW